MSKPPNIIYLLSDQHRHDALGCAGNPVVQTPNLDRMASEGVRFTRTYCQSPICQPSRASVLTGLYAHQHGLSTNFRGDFDPEWDTLARHLQQVGYTTALVGKTHFYSPKGDQFTQTPDGPTLDLRQFENFVKSFGFDYVLEEFDRYVHAFPQATLITNYSEYLKAKGLLESYRKQIQSIWRLTPEHWNGVTSVLPQEDDLTFYIADRAIDWLEQYDGDGPFFLNVSFVQPHVPLMDDPIWAEHYRDVEIPLGPRQPPRNPGGVWGDYLDNFLFKHSNSHLLTDEYVTNGARHYYGMVSLIDQRIGDIMRTVEDRGWGGNTWFVYSADHGEMLGDHNLMAKMNFYKSSVLVPAIVRLPEPMVGKVVNSIVESIDLSATILDAAGAAPLEDSQGRSLIPFLEGDGKPKEAAFSAISRGSDPEQYFIMVATEQYRLTLERNTGQFCELFDLKNDPDELNNLVDDPAFQGVREDMKKDLLEPHLAL